MVHHMICGLCFPLFLFVCFVCRHEIFVPRVLSLQSLTLGTNVLLCGLSEHNLGMRMECTLLQSNSHARMSKEAKELMEK